MIASETYQTTGCSNGSIGTFFFTDCGNRMYTNSNNDMKYHGALCPKCLSEGKQVVLYLRGTKEAKEIVNHE